MPGGKGGFAQNRNIGLDELDPQRFSRLKNRRYTLEMFDTPPWFGASTGNGAATGGTGAINLIHTAKGIYEYVILGAGQTIIVPIWDRTNGKGLQFSQDQTATEGHELSFAPNITTAGQARGKHNYTIGTDKAFFARLKFTADDVSGFNPFFFGFIRCGAYQTAIGSYTDYAGFKAVGAGTIADLNIETRLNSGTVSTVDTTINLADNDVVELEIRVSQTGVVRFRYNGFEGGAGLPNPVSGFVFDAGDVVRPAAFFLHGADLVDNIWYQEFESGFLPEKAV